MLRGQNRRIAEPAKTYRRLQASRYGGKIAQPAQSCGRANTTELRGTQSEICKVNLSRLQTRVTAVLKTKLVPLSSESLSIAAPSKQLVLPATNIHQASSCKSKANSQAQATRTGSLCSSRSLLLACYYPKTALDVLAAMQGNILPLTGFWPGSKPSASCKI